MLGNHFQLAIGSHPLESLDFDFEVFTRHFDQKPIEIFHGIKSLESQGFILLTESFYQPSKVLFSLDHKAIYEFQIANGSYDAVIKGLLRLYGGELYNYPVQIKENGLSALLGVTMAECVAILNQLAERQVIEYFQQKDKPQLTMLLPRFAEDKLPIDKKRLNTRRKLTLKKMESVISYLHNEDRCRTQQILEYFGEISYDKCDVCDICISNRKRYIDEELKSHYRKQIENTLHESVDLDLQQLIKILFPEDKDLFSELISEMLDHGIVYYDDFGKLKPSK